MGIDAVATTHRSGVVDCNDCVQARCATAFYEMLSPLNDCAKAPVVGQQPMGAIPFATTWRTKPSREGVGKAEPHVVRRLFTSVGLRPQAMQCGIVGLDDDKPIEANITSGLVLYSAGVAEMLNVPSRRPI